MRSYSDLGMMIEAYLKIQTCSGSVVLQPSEHNAWLEDYSLLCAILSDYMLLLYCQELERSMDLHTCSVDTMKLKYKLVVSTTRNKNVCQKVL